MDPTAPVAPAGMWRTEGGITTLVGGRSRSSGLLHFPRSPVCPYRGTDDVDEVDLPRTGTLWACTTVQTAPPGYTGPVPYRLGVVELDPDPSGQVLRVVGRIEGDDEPATGWRSSWSTSPPTTVRSRCGASRRRRGAPGERARGVGGRCGDRALRPPR